MSLGLAEGRLGMDRCVSQPEEVPQLGAPSIGFELEPKSDRALNLGPPAGLPGALPRLDALGLDEVADLPVERLERVRRGRHGDHRRMHLAFQVEALALAP